MLLRIIIFLTFPILLSGCSGNNDNSGQPVDVSGQFFQATSPWSTHDPLDILSGRTAGLDFEPVITPRQMKRDRNDLWLKTSLIPSDGDQNSQILEIPGHLYARVDIWFQLQDGQVLHQRSGNKYPYVDRSVKHSGTAFPVPGSNGTAVDVLIKIRTGTPVNFTALLWETDAWDDYLFKQRGWYGIFFGAILILCFYNIFLAFTLKDVSYLYYVGYILSLAAVVILYSGLAEEYLWPQGKSITYVLMVSGVGIFFGISFVNSFLRIKDRLPVLYRLSVAVALLALVFGVLHALKIHIVPYQLRGPVMHILLLLGCFYFIGVSIVSYLMGFKQSRFLALSMLALLGGMAIYLMYTYGLIKYNLYLIHALEMGSLVEGVLLSLALSDRINLLSKEKDKAEKKAMDSQQSFSRHLLKAQEIDRERYSNAMHDSIGHGMLVLKQNLDRISNSMKMNQNPTDGDDYESVLAQAEYCGEILGDVRRISHDLHPHLLKRLGLKAAIESTLERAFTPQGIEWQADIVDLSGIIDSEREIIIYRVIQECVNNILKHADASEVVLMLRVSGGTVLVNIKDDGVGFDPNEKTASSLGLDEMKGRITLFGGWFEVRAEKGAGTHIKFGLPGL